MTETPAGTARGRQRPLSPHLQVYRLPMPAIASITHRITGVGLTLGTLMLTCWLLAATTGAEAFDRVQGFLGSPFGWLLMAGWTWALWYHGLNGIRHLVWDTGRGLDLADVTRGGYIIFGASILLTLVTLGVAVAA
jgi:succinate dehydrogenase / fumarate reductase, cytochrome b subunit